MKKTTMLMILDGYGCCKEVKGNAIAAAHTPNLDALFSKYPHTQLAASGLAVGLPKGQMGNSEVGHLNIGAGRIVYQDLTRISKAIEDKTFSQNQVLQDAMNWAKSHDSALHLLGLLSDGGVHSHITHLFALLDLAKAHGLSKVFVHCFLDGRDVPPCNAQTYIQALEEYMKQLKIGQIATICGRYYAMDRDNRWERVKLAYDALTSGLGIQAESAENALHQAYLRDETDEFVLPSIIPGGRTISNDDSVILFNFRPDRAREITRAFVDPEFKGFDKISSPKNLHFVCMTQYDAAMPNVQVAFPPQNLKNTLGEYLSHLGLKQLRIAETEKYAHVTFFFNGGVEEPNKNEDRVLIPSPKVATYDLQPEMSAYQVKDQVIKLIQDNIYDVIILNFANADMVGHTGVFGATVAAVEAVDRCVGEITNAMLQAHGRILLTADHGNADIMMDSEENTLTAHSVNPVPLILIEKDAANYSLKDGGALCDIAPTLLECMGLAQPKEMTGRSLRIKNT